MAIGNVIYTKGICHCKALTKWIEHDRTIWPSVLSSSALVPFQILPVGSCWYVMHLDHGNALLAPNASLALTVWVNSWDKICEVHTDPAKAILIHPHIIQLPSGNLTWLWKITMLNAKIYCQWSFSIAM